MSIIALRTDAEFTWLEIEGQLFFITPNHELAEETCLRCVEDLEFLRETVTSQINAIRFQSDAHVDVKESKIDKLDRALGNVGIPRCDHIEEVHYEGVDLVIGYNFDHDECHRNSPAYLEVISITHRGQDITGLIDLLGGPAGFDKIADLLEGDK
jgi:hypothetical protein